MRRTVWVLILGIVISSCFMPNFSEAKPTTFPSTAATAQHQKTADKVVAAALKYKGVPYCYGGVSPQGFDCSGLVWYVFDRQGKKLPRTADAQFKTGSVVMKTNLQPGDVVFFATETKGKGVSHCGIYVGKGQFVHASSSRGVMVSSLTDGYWQPKYVGARRMIEK